MIKEKTSCGWSCAKLTFSLSLDLDLARGRFVHVCSKVRSTDQKIETWDLDAI